MNSSLEQGNNPSFFKFLTDDSADCLICPAFVRRFSEGKYPKNPIRIETESKESWAVEIAQIDGKLCFVNGWLQFMKDNLLETGDFLVFWLIADSTFQVTMYGPSCCEKRSNLRGNVKRRASRHEYDKKKPEVEKESGGSHSQHPWCSRVMMKSHNYLMPLASRFGRETGIASKKSVVLRDEEEREWQIRVVKRNCGYYITRGWFNFRRANQVQVGDTCVFTLITPPPTSPPTPSAQCPNLILDVQVVRKTKKKRGRPRGSTKTPMKCIPSTSSPSICECAWCPGPSY